MKNLLVILSIFFISSCADKSPLPSSAVLPSAKKCQITCYEKTPSCYVSSEGSNCLAISNVLKKDEKKSVCTLKSCNVQTSY